VAAEITHETAATTPPDRTRTTIGVGEVVTLTFPFSDTTWSLSGPGTLSATSGSSVEFTASDRASSPTITAFHKGIECRSVAFSVIEPSGVMMETIAGSLVCQTSPLALQYHAEIYIPPDSVSFSKAYFGEGTATPETSGYFVYESNDVHEASSAMGSGSTVVAGKGTNVGSDTIQGITTGAVYSAGSFIWNIPWFYKTLTSTGSIQFSTVPEVKTLSVTGSNAVLQIQKAGSSGTCAN